MPNELQNALTALKLARQAFKWAGKSLLCDEVSRLIEETEAEVKWDGATYSTEGGLQ